VSTAADRDPEPDRQERILDAVVDRLARGGISAVSMRAVAQQAGVSLGLLNYHFADKAGLVRAALLRIEEQDLALLDPGPGTDPQQQLREVLGRIAQPRYLAADYLAQRLQLWSLAQADPSYAQINAQSQQRYREGLTALLARARPDLSRPECRRRAADIDVVQNGIWLTALLGLDRASIRRSVARCEAIAFD